jgi:hypothetical protein
MSVLKSRPAATGVCLFVLSALACTSAGRAVAAGPPDQPVPPDEPRAELLLKIDMAASSTCEESFDLALYQDRGVELVEWDDQNGKCQARAVRIRYLPRKLGRDKLIERVKALSTRAAAQ